MSTDRTDWTQGLRGLADVLDYVPELPLPHELSVPLTGTDSKAGPQFESIAQALERSGVPFDRVDGKHLQLVVSVGTLRFRVYRVPDADLAQHCAVMSYADSVQVDADTDHSNGAPQ